MKTIHLLIGALGAAIVLSVVGLSLEKSAEASGAVYVQRFNPVDRNTHEFVTATPVDAGEGETPNQSALLNNGVSTYAYPGRCGWTHDQYVMCWRDGGTPRYWRLAFANSVAPSATPEWEYTTTGNFIDPIRGATTNVSIGQVTVPQAGAKFEVVGSSFLTGAVTTKPLAGAHLIVNSAKVDANTSIFGDPATVALFVEGSTGYVGIGTQNPGTIAHVVGLSDPEGAGNGAGQLAVSDSGDETKRVYLGYEDTWDAGTLWASDLGAGGKDIIISPLGGNVGIGLIDPNTLLHVDGDVTVGDDTTTGSFVNIVGAGVSDFGIQLGTEANPDATAAIYSNTGADGINFEVLNVVEGFLDTGFFRVGNTATTGSFVNIVGAGVSQFGIQLGTEADPDASAAVYAFTGAAGLFFDLAPGAEVMRLTTAGLSIGLAATPDSRLHAWNATAGAIAAVAGTLITAENNADAFITILSPTANTGGIYFGSTAGNTRGGVTYTHSTHGTPDILSFTTSSAAQWQIDASGDLLATTDNADDIGASGATRPQNVYIANDIKDVRLIHADQKAGVPASITPFGFTVSASSFDSGSNSMRGEFQFTVDSGTFGDGDAVLITYHASDNFDTGNNGNAVPLVQLKSSPTPSQDSKMFIVVTGYSSSSFTITVYFEAGFSPAHDGVYEFVYQVMG